MWNDENLHGAWEAIVRDFQDSIYEAQINRMEQQLSESIDTTDLVQDDKAA